MKNYTKEFSLAISCDNLMCQDVLEQMFCNAHSLGMGSYYDQVESGRAVETGEPIDWDRIDCLELARLEDIRQFRLIIEAMATY